MLLSAFGQFNQRGGRGGGGCCLLSADSTSKGGGGGGGGGCCPLLADSTSGGGGGGSAVRFQPIQPVGGMHVCKLLLQGYRVPEMRLVLAWWPR